MIRIIIMSLFLAACGAAPEQSAKAPAEQPAPAVTGFQDAIALASVADLPPCVDSRQGWLAYVKDSATFYACDKGSWSAIDLKGKDGHDGRDGTPGSGGAGSAGPAGPQGDQGPVGPVGPQGPKGDSGAQGPAGQAGSTVPSFTDTATGLTWIYLGWSPGLSYWGGGGGCMGDFRAPRTPEVQAARVKLTATFNPGKTAWSVVVDSQGFERLQAVDLTTGQNLGFADQTNVRAGFCVAQ